MRIRRWILLGCVAGSLAALPATAAAEPAECVAGKPTAASYTWNFQTEARDLLQQVQSEATQVRQHASVLKHLARNVDFGWESQVDQLDLVKAEVNDMGAKLCRLTVIRRVAAPWQQAAIDRITPELQMIANNADDAIQFVNRHQEALWQPVYTRYVDNLYQEANSVSNTVNNFEAYAHARTEYRELRETLGIKTSS